MPSFDSVNYSIRPNKTVERKLVFSGLVEVSAVLDIPSYKFVGMGSLWFVDFLLAHRVLSIKSMTSIEQSELGYKRALYNCPLSCISVLKGDVSTVLPTLPIGESPHLMWFDYEGSISGSVLTDIESAIERCAPNSVLIVTINAKLDQLPQEDHAGEKLSVPDSLRSVAGDLVPNPLAPQRLRASDYPRLLSEIIQNQFVHVCAKSARGLTFTKLFDLPYSDGTPMITVGGVLSDSDHSASLAEIIGNGKWRGVVDEVISIPPLTVKEKLALDRLMPSSTVPTDKEMNKIGFNLKKEQLEAYHRHYLEYPLFAEFI